MKRNVAIALLSLSAVVVLLGATATAVLAGGGFDQYGYNNTARIFNGTGSSWSLSKGLPADYLGVYANDKLVMKWNAEWDRGNDEGWARPPYAAWEDNEWNGKVPGGSGAVWHYKIVWVGSCGADYTPLPNGGYCIWGQFEVIMDQGVDPNVGPGHMFFAKAGPAGYGAYK
ncbi:MAG: hypothetical protein M1370_00905 [Bacteroidetes bacterium]|nr:hypothetical protein [Bacteroidota bacterium]MCL5025548.1 hypothetical protein [Chloroflexota bacterium]